MIDHSQELIPEMTAREVGDLLTQGADFVLLDVREPYELNWARLEDDRVLHVPLSYVAQRGLAALPDGLRQHPGPLVVLCHLGFRSAQVTAWLRQMGWTNVYNLAGGIDAYARQIDPGVGYYS
jgi:rhodanese-related sulfurtransferase